jgi:hypothetical protein
MELVGGEADARLRRRPRSTSLARLDSPATRTHARRRLVEPAEGCSNVVLPEPDAPPGRDSITLRDFELDAAQHRSWADDPRYVFTRPTASSTTGVVSLPTCLGRRLARGAERRIQRREIGPSAENRDLGDLSSWLREPSLKK